MERQPGRRSAVDGWRETAVAGVAFVLLAIAATWPLARNLDRAVSDPGDPLLTTWILDWDWWATFHAPLSLYHAPAFHPARYALAFTENLYGIAVLLFPLRFAGLGPVTAHNVAMLLGFAFCGFGAYVLGRRLTGSFVAGIAAGVFYMLVPWRFIHLSHIQHIWGGWLPLLPATLIAFHQRPTWKRGALVAAVFVMNGLTNIHYLFFGALATAITAALLLPRSSWRALAVPMLVGLLVLAPFLYPYLIVAKTYGMQRGAEEVAAYSAVPGDWLPGEREPERMLYPGALAYLSLLLALFARERAKLALALLWIVIGFAGSLGMNFVFHEFLFGAVPGFRAIRAPARWAVIAYVGLAICIALVTATIARRNRWVAALVPLAFGVSLWAAPVRWYLLDPNTPPVYRWLARQRVAAAIELPMDTMTSEYEYLLHATRHRQRLANGVSGFAPPLRDELSRLSRELGDPFVDELQKAGIELLIVHGDRYGAEGPQLRAWLKRELERGRLRYVAHFDAKTGADWVFSLRGGKGPRPRDLEVFLFGAAVCTQSIAGALDEPPGEHRFRGAARFRGWASSPHGVKRVDLWFDNRGDRYPARIVTIPYERCPGAPPVRFELDFARRPEEVRVKTDVQVEIIDGRGRTAVLDDRWISWE